MIKWFIPLLFILLITGCTTLNVKEQESGINNIIELINKGESEKLIAASRIPFLYDGEIILLQKDMSLLWDSLCKAGFSIDDPEVTTISYIDDNTYALFTASMEGKAFFKRHLPDKTIVTALSAKEGNYYFLTGSRKNGLITIFGMKGPVQ
ncbi:MAG: hypothetical protein JXJ04_24290 [Spirochaetales bacterium]|nr:hypothetical protein [Spirochaetales bacterium]